MSKKRLYPLSRLEGEALVRVFWDARGRFQGARLEFPSWRGFEKLLLGRLAEEAPRLVTRICGLCPWMHHLASVRAVEACFGVHPPAPAQKLRELALLLAHYGDKVLHFCFLSLPDFWPEIPPEERHFWVLKEKAPTLLAEAAQARQEVQRLLEIIGGRAVHPVTAVPGGMTKALDPQEREDLLEGAWRLYRFALKLWQFAEKEFFKRWEEVAGEEASLQTGFLALRGAKGAFSLQEGQLCLMRPDGSTQEFPPERYAAYLAEHIEPWTYGKMPYAKVWGEGFSLDPENPLGIYRVNTLARINIAESMGTPKAQEALEDFRARFGRPAQATILYHWARLIELLFVSERIIQVLDDPLICAQEVWVKAHPRAGEGVGCLEAPRGTLIHHYETDAEGRIVRANLIVGTTHNTAPLNLEVGLWAQKIVAKRGWEELLYETLARRIRAYDP